MHVILGATGHIGSELSRLLLARGESVTVVARSEDKLQPLRMMGAEVAPVDVKDVKALRAVFRRGQRLFLLNPPAPPTSDTDREERASLRAILEALEGVELERIVAASTFGAQAGEHIGDLGVLHEMEQALARQEVPVSIVRGAYYFTNWDMALQSAAGQGVVQTFFPPDFRLPMVAPRDLAVVAAALLTVSEARPGLFQVEGPRRYSPADVATACAQALGRPVQVESVPRARWVETFRGLGFSPEAAESYARMTEATVDGTFPEPGSTLHGRTALEDYVTERCSGRPASPAHHP
ncbi:MULTISPECIES: NAD(P)H-binding protein [Corallococcus]|uniref:NAD(P)H-binding protein n=1 Tax=Corallococcus TaxID=83461 RepID=UPI000EE69855|nr:MULTISPECIES: NAD(P)H-binding protein [Corallococcus]NPC72495.1 NAD(P)H-binding protein [Corallococcus exiguus]NPD23037.1 NAD(P)H-binding protein [Corallococcus exiguus]NRD44092.1 NAD(P)H-binding protein [Corallococcus exiguus]RKH99679.1 NAD-dependent epimerase/dehydratase family protein [Corallococcus sp. AB038B]